jgi:hypothetical protein
VGASAAAGASRPFAGYAARPAPAPAAAAEAVGIAEEPLAVDPDAERCWHAVIAGLNARKRVLGAFLEESRFAGIAGDALVLQLDDLHRAVVEEKENRALIADEVRRAFGRPLALRCTATETAAAPRRPTLDEVKPMIDQAIAWFQGEVVERRVRNGEARER